MIKYRKKFQADSECIDQDSNLKIQYTYYPF